LKEGERRGGEDRKKKEGRRNGDCETTPKINPGYRPVV